MTEPIEEVLELRARFDEEPSHSDQVRHLALGIFDGLPSWHRLAARDRSLLGAAALLHDIGWSQTPDGHEHHKASARLIRAQAWRTLSRAEVEVLAQVARYHRKSVPQPAHADFAALDSPAQRRVFILGGILRLADALDRTHTSRVREVTSAVRPDALVVRAQVAGPWPEEKAMFLQKRDMLEKVAALPVEIEAEPETAKPF